MAGNENVGIPSVNTLLAGYRRLNFFKRWFFPELLKSALESYEKATNRNEAAFAVYQIYFAHTNFITRWLFTCLNLFKTEYLTEKLQLLTNQPEEFRSIFLLYTHNFIELIKTNFETLFCGEHAQKYFETLACHASSDNSAASFLIDLSTSGLLPQDQEKAYEYFLIAFDAHDPMFLQEAKKLLLKFELLNPAHLGALAPSIDSFKTCTDIEFILENLLKVNLLKGNETISYLSKVAQSSDKTKLREAFEILISAHSFQKEYIDKLLDPNQFTHFFSKLRAKLIDMDIEQQTWLNNDDIQTIFQEPILATEPNIPPASSLQTPYNHFQPASEPSPGPIQAQTILTP